MRYPPMVDLNVVAQALNITYSAAAHQALRNSLPFERHKFGKVVRFRRADIEAFLGTSLEEALGERV